MSFHPTHRNLFPTFSSASSSVSEHSLGRGSCAGVFLQLFDWNCRRKRRFRRKSLPAERLSPILKDNVCRDNNPPTEDGSVEITAGHGNADELCRSQESGDVGLCRPLETPESKKKKKSPNVVAKLMGLETMPSPEFLSKRKPLTAWNPNSIHNSKISYQSPDSIVSSFRGKPLKLEKRMMNVFREKQELGEHDSQNPVVNSASTHEGWQELRLRDANSLLMVMLSPSCDKNANKGSISSPSKIYKPVVSPIRRPLPFKDTTDFHESRNRIPVSHIQCRKVHTVGEAVASSTLTDKKANVDNKNTTHLIPLLDTGSKRLCASSAAYPNSRIVQASCESAGKIGIKGEIAPSSVTSTKRQRLSFRSHNDHISTQSAVRPVLKPRNERASVLNIESKRKECMPSGSNAPRREEEIIAQRLMQGKSVDGKDYGKCHHNEHCLTIGSKPKTSKDLHRRSGTKADNFRFLTAKSQQGHKVGSTNSRNQRHLSTKSVATRDNFEYLKDGRPCIFGKETGKNNEPMEIKEGCPDAGGKDPSPLLRPSLLKQSDGIKATISTKQHKGMPLGESRVSAHENVDLLKQKYASDVNALASFQEDVLNESSTSCITDDVHAAPNIQCTADLTVSDISGQQNSSRGSAHVTGRSYEDAESSINYDGTDGQGIGTSDERKSFLSHPAMQDTYQSICSRSSKQDVEDTASTNGKILPVSYSGKSTATILQELLMALNLSMKRSSHEEDSIEEKSDRAESGLGINASINSITTEKVFDVSEDSADLGIVFNRISDDTTKVNERISFDGKHTLQECEDKCWYQTSFRENVSDCFRVPIAPASPDRYNEDSCDVKLWSNSEVQDILESEEEYVNYIVSKAHLSPHSVYSARLGLSGALIEQALLFELENNAKNQWKWGLNSLPASNSDMGEATRVYRKLIFDCVKEGLELDMGIHEQTLQQNTCHVLCPSSSTYLAIGVHRKIQDWKSMKCRMNVDDMVENYMNTGAGKWIDFSNEISEIAKEVESNILTELVGELVSGVSIRRSSSLLTQNGTCRMEGRRTRDKGQQWLLSGTAVGSYIS